MQYTLKQWRRLRNMTQEQLAEAVDRAPITILNWENGKSEPKYKDVLKLRLALRLEPTDVILMP